MYILNKSTCINIIYSSSDLSRFIVTTNDLQVCIVFLRSSSFSTRVVIDDEAGKAFSSCLKGMASKNFSPILTPF